MNRQQKQDIRRLAGFIASEGDNGRFGPDLDFDMRLASFDTERGTAGCIGGHAALLWPSVRDPSFESDGSRNSGVFDDDKLATRLGLSEEELEDLCYDCPDARGDEIALRLVTRAAAVDALLHLAETGQVRFRRNLCRRG